LVFFADSSVLVVHPILTAVFGTTSRFAPKLTIITKEVIVGALPVKDAAAA
jgi:hypothetical protein